MGGYALQHGWLVDEHTWKIKNGTKWIGYFWTEVASDKNEGGKGFLERTSGLLETFGFMLLFGYAPLTPNGLNLDTHLLAIQSPQFFSVSPVLELTGTALLGVNHVHPKKRYLERAYRYINGQVHIRRTVDQSGEGGVPTNKQTGSLR